MKWSGNSAIFLEKSGKSQGKKLPDKSGNPELGGPFLEVKPCRNCGSEATEAMPATQASFKIPDRHLINSSPAAPDLIWATKRFFTSKADFSVLRGTGRFV